MTILCQKESLASLLLFILEDSPLSLPEMKITQFFMHLSMSHNKKRFSRQIALKNDYYLVLKATKIPLSLIADCYKNQTCHPIPLFLRIIFYSLKNHFS